MQKTMNFMEHLRGGLSIIAAAYWTRLHWSTFWKPGFALYLLLQMLFWSCQQSSIESWSLILYPFAIPNFLGFPGKSSLLRRRSFGSSRNLSAPTNVCWTTGIVNRYLYYRTSVGWRSVPDFESKAFCIGVDHVKLGAEIGEGTIHEPTTSFVSCGVWGISSDSAK